eukprot:GFKZ01000732.1.p1 GENE.GFKZ01000732.1~~GFKZ01000732.1.p1  ORF type:complete len:283 (+),score=16.56 GFKZ01000732.1:1898-2746(+)
MTLEIPAPTPIHPTTSPDPPQPLFHLGYTLPADKTQLSSLRSTRFVLICGSARRALVLASNFTSRPPSNICLTDRYSLYHPCPEVLVASHGIGVASLDVLLHELHTLLQGVGARDWSLIRVGSCGGIGIEAGSVIVSEKVLNGGWEPQWRVWEGGESHVWPVVMDHGLRGELFKVGYERLGPGCVCGVTLCADTFYGGQGRGKGDAERWVAKCEQWGVVGVEMEGLALGAFAERVGVKAAMVLAVLVDRKTGEIPVGGEHVLKGYEDRAVAVVVRFVKAQLP